MRPRARHGSDEDAWLKAQNDKVGACHLRDAVMC